MKTAQPLVAFLSFGFIAFGYAFASDEDEQIIDCDGEAATTQFCIDKEKAFELRARIEVLYPSLKELPSPPWDEEEFLAAETSYEEGVNLYQDEYFGDAVPKFELALDAFTLLEESLQTTADEMREAISGYFDSSAYDTVITELDILLEWHPEDEELIRLHTEAMLGHSLKPLVEDVQNYVSIGSFKEAQEILDQLPPGYYQQEVSQAQDAIEVHRQETAFNSTMTTGYQHIAEENWVVAQQSLETALRIQPNSKVATDLLKEVKENHRLFQIDVLTTEMSNAVEAEQWEEALTKVEEVEGLDIKDELDYSDLKAELDELLALDSELVEYQSIDFDSLDEQTREDITLLLDETDELNQFDRIQSKRQTLADRFEQYTTPVEVTILSDNSTKVRIRPGKTIGSFRSKKLEILPGTYEIIGTRRGFKQIIEKLKILPGSDPVEIKVECSVRF